MATKQLGGKDECAVTSFMTVARNDLQTATNVMAFFAAYNSTDDGDDDRPLPSNLNVTATFCGVGTAKTATSARVRRIDAT